MNIADFKTKLFAAAKAKGISDIELIYMNSKSDEISVYNSDVENFQSSSQGGIGVRGLYKDVMGYYYSETVEEKDVDGIIAAVMENAEVIDSEDPEFIFEGSKCYAEVDIYDEAVNAYTTEKRIEDALKMEKAALAYDERIKSVSNAVVAGGESETYLANSKGLELSEKNNYIMAYVELIAEQNGSTKEKGELWIGRAADLDCEAIAKRAAEKAVKALGGSPVKSGTFKAIIQNDVFAENISFFAKTS